MNERYAADVDFKIEYVCVRIFAYQYNNKYELNKYKMNKQHGNVKITPVSARK